MEADIKLYEKIERNNKLAGVFPNMKQISGTLSFNKNYHTITIKTAPGLEGKYVIYIIFEKKNITINGSGKLASKSHSVDSY